MKYLVDANVLSELTKPSPDPRVVDWLHANIAVDRTAYWNFSVYSKPFTKRHLEGRKRAPRFHQRASSSERPCVLPCQNKRSLAPYSALKTARPH
jgi:hypothetical protein